MKEGIGTHSLWTLPVLGPVHADTIMTTWLAMVVCLIALAYVGNSYRSPKVGRTQTVFEGVVDYIADMVHGSLGKSGEPFVPFFISLFIFIFLLNQFGIFPFREIGLPLGGSPTGDINTTVALALIVFVLIQFMTLKRKGIGGYAHLFNPWFLAPINILEELVRPVTLAARLFFNIFVGELLFIIIASIVTAKVMIGPVNLSIAVAVLPFFIQFFNFFVGSVQSFVFTLLGIVYLSLATADDH